MEVLVGCDAGHDLAAGWVGQGPPRVVVGDSGGELLQRRIRERVGQGRRLGDHSVRDLGHPRPLERDRIDRARHRQIVPNDDGVAALFCGPAANPGSPCVVAAEPSGDGPEVVREIVLGEEVHEQRAAGGGADAVVIGLPLGIVAEIPSLTPRNERVREPLPGRGEVPLEEFGGAGLELGEESGLVHAGVPTDQSVGQHEA
jgi:hypothetical protein